MLFHFSEDPNIERFSPHVPRTNPTHPAAVWALDADHSPLYWFPRNCPRIAVWARDADEQRQLSTLFLTDARRVHIIELGWLERMRVCQLFVYELPLEPFRPWQEATGQWITGESVEPVSVEPVGDLLARHVAAGIELRLAPTLWRHHDAVLASGLDFSMVRLANAEARPPAQC